MDINSILHKIDFNSLLSSKVQSIGFLIVKTLAIFILGWFIANRLSSLIQTILKKSPLDKTIRRSLQHLIALMLKGLLIVIILNSLGVDLSIIIALLGGLSIGFGLALKSNISNFADGVIILASRYFKVGDYIEINGLGGSVEKTNVFSTELISVNNQKMFIPNSTISNSSIVNFSAYPTRRIDLVLGLSYTDDLELATQLLKQAANSVVTILNEPETEVWLTDFGDSSINFSIRSWCKRTDFLTTRHHLILAIKKMCDQNNLNIPFPQREFTLTK